MKYEKNQIKEVSEKIAKGTAYQPIHIEKILRKYEKFIEIELNLYNIDNNSITWYNNSQGLIVMFDDGRVLQGININEDKLLNNYECELILGV